MVPLPMGWITIWGINDKGDRTLLVDRKNALTTNAKKIIAYLLGSQSSYALDAIKVYKAASLLATSPALTVSFPIGDDKVKFSVRFDEASFDDTLDELRLVSLAGGEFSLVTGLSVFKDDTLQLQIEWVLTIADL